MIYKGSDNSGLRQAGIACPRKMTLGSWFQQIHIQIQQDDFPGANKSRKMTYRGLANLGLSSAGMG